MPKYAALLAPCLTVLAMAAHAQAATPGQTNEAFSEIARLGIMQETGELPSRP